MRYTRPALAITTALLALTGIATTAHADDDHSKEKGKGKGNLCVIEVKGNHNHNACGNIEYGNNATTGNEHTVISGRLGDEGDGCIRVVNYLTDTGINVTGSTTPPATWNVTPPNSIINFNLPLNNPDQNWCLSSNNGNDTTTYMQAAVNANLILKWQVDIGPLIANTSNVGWFDANNQPATTNFQYRFYNVNTSMAMRICPPSPFNCSGGL
ncbi:hypothetical protein [Streptomyces sp. NBC_01264]|uniref:hypothetical protein n=1 Tax=Streptomyces sp. NBC_01264 TaxID=2903804 RepID=UPI00224EFEA3|nr:hypothetical protein [Streptomyces sp. NBC_01264]MCX4784208.1 hypothetical protein [Streptomyces sp. NBC_01264]